MADFIYVPYTVRVTKEGVHLFDADCELRINYELPEGRSGPVDWDVAEFHFSQVGVRDSRTTYTKITRHEPLFGVLYACLDMDWIDAQVREDLAHDGIVDQFQAPTDAQV